MIDECDRLIGLIYEGIVDDFHWGGALDRVAAFVGAVGVGLGMQDIPPHLSPRFSSTVARISV
jgi:hypothetical protein